jgi:hypothetical protein
MATDHGKIVVRRLRSFPQTQIHRPEKREISQSRRDFETRSASALCMSIFGNPFKNSQTSVQSLSSVVLLNLFRTPVIFVTFAPFVVEFRLVAGKFPA